MDPLAHQGREPLRCDDCGVEISFAPAGGRERAYLPRDPGDPKIRCAACLFGPRGARRKP